MADARFPFTWRFGSRRIVEAIAHMTEHEKHLFRPINQTDLKLRGFTLSVGVFLLVRGVSSGHTYKFLPEFPPYFLLVPALFATLWSEWSVRKYLRATEYVKNHGIVF